VVVEGASRKTQLMDSRAAPKCGRAMSAFRQRQFDLIAMGSPTPRGISLDDIARKYAVAPEMARFRVNTTGAARQINRARAY
jgi:hypothetical protein